jgi:hypothetical protein
MNQEFAYLRGALIAYEPDGYPDRKRVIPFRFNPESLARQVSVEKAQGQQGAGTAPPGDSAATEQGADASEGTARHSFNVMIRLDFAERHQPAAHLPAELGVAPEIAAIEDLMYPGDSDSEAASDGTEAVHARPRRPTVLFVWGRKRVYPVRITGMTITESVYNAQLNPVRAEIDVSLEVLTSEEASDNLAVSSALSFTESKRKELAKLLLDNTADQSTSILPL